MKNKLLVGFLILAGVVAFKIAPAVSAIQLYNPQFNYSYFDTNTNTSTACEVLYGAAGTLHALMVGTPGNSGVVTLYDTNNGSVRAMTAATASIFVGPIGSTSTATGTVSFLLNGQTVTTASITNGSSTTDVATAITTAITASSTVLGVTATSSVNVVTITASVTGAVGNINLPAIPPQDGFLFYNTLINSSGTQIISQTTFSASSSGTSYPETALYDSVFTNGICVQETTATSAVTVSWQRQ